ncbi:MAG: hypothetical protein C4K58_04175 [Flavobacteriaceae bacterium]|nr:MAG: hypothetical protein C4K58_04175 [Flavobacteriaceae bacterium]
MNVGNVNVFVGIQLLLLAFWWLIGQRKSKGTKVELEQLQERFNNLHAKLKQTRLESKNLARENQKK